MRVDVYAFRVERHISQKPWPRKTSFAFSYPFHSSKLIFMGSRWDSHFLGSEYKEFIMGRKETPQKPSRSEVFLFRALLRCNYKVAESKSASFRKLFSL